MIKSTKFWTTIVAMCLLSIIQGGLIYRDIYDYNETYFWMMGGLAGLYGIGKGVQNVVYGALNGNGNNHNGNT